MELYLVCVLMNAAVFFFYFIIVFLENDGELDEIGFQKELKLKWLLIGFVIPFILFCMIVKLIRFLWKSKIMNAKIMD